MAVLPSRRRSRWLLLPRPAAVGMDGGRRGDLLLGGTVLGRGAIPAACDSGTVHRQAYVPDLGVGSGVLRAGALYGGYTTQTSCSSPC